MPSGASLNQEFPWCSAIHQGRAADGFGGNLTIDESSTTELAVSRAQPQHFDLVPNLIPGYDRPPEPCSLDGHEEEKLVSPARIIMQDQNPSGLRHPLHQQNQASRGYRENAH